jgi:rfaE bifunctional protein nucleotidyltransferase chain/domain
VKIVLAAGCFDPLHWGHLKHLEQARAMGDYLTVALTSDSQLTSEKGAGRPVFTAQQRKEMLEALRCVSQVVVVDSTIEALYAIWPQVFVKGAEYRGRIKAVDEMFCKLHDVAIVHTDGPVYSSTKLLAHYAR